MKIAHFGTFDVDNYGDLLFPHIVEWRLPSSFFIHISPTNNRLKFSDASETMVMNDSMDISFDGVFIGGGNIVHLRDCPLKEYLGIEKTAIPSLIIGAANLASKQNIPLIFNGPSIRNFDFGKLEKYLLKNTITKSLYSAFRDQYSFDTGCRLGAVTAAFIPDTAFDIGRMWPKEEFYRDDIDKNPYLVVHLNSRYGGNINDVAKSIDRIVERYGDVEVRFLPLGLCHGDMEYTRAVVNKISSRYKIIIDFSLKNFAFQIAHSLAYFGSSMHGFITALSYKVPALLVLNHNPLDKFAGLLTMVKAPKEVVVANWIGAASKPSPAWTISDAMLETVYKKLDNHWEIINNKLMDSNVNRHSLLETVILRNWRFFTLLSQFEVFCIQKILKMKKQLFK